MEHLTAENHTVQTKPYGNLVYFGEMLVPDATLCD